MYLFIHSFIHSFIIVFSLGTNLKQLQEALAFPQQMKASTFSYGIGWEVWEGVVNVLVTWPRPHALVRSAVSVNFLHDLVQSVSGGPRSGVGVCVCDRASQWADHVWLTDSFR